MVITNIAFNDHAGAWDAVVTCFFIDTAHNVVEYIEIISRILKDGGVSSFIFQIDLFISLISSPSICSLCFLLSHFDVVFHTWWHPRQIWINLGPLLYHFADMYGQEDVRFNYCFHVKYIITCLECITLIWNLSAGNVHRIEFGRC